MLYSIGYQKMKTAKELIEKLQENQIEALLDVRSKPSSRNASFRKNHLAEALPKAGIRYEWVGQILGGFSEIEEKDIKALAGHQRGRRVCLMCMEANPDKCHRKYEIGKRIKKYDVSVHHL